MKLAGAGRIVLWNGGSLWIGRAGGVTDFHAHHAVQISLALSGADIRLRKPGDTWHSHTTAVVGANQEHAFASGGDFVANIFVEPESHAGQTLQQLCAGRGIHSVAAHQLADGAAALLHAYQCNAVDSTLVAAAQRLVARIAATTTGPPGTLDPRIKRALDFIRARIRDESIALDAAAGAAHLSADRFRHLFLEQTGIRFRPYVLWLRLEVALAEYAAHSKLTEAAQAGGFADSAHFSRTFKSMFGIAPSAIQID